MGDARSEVDRQVRVVSVWRHVNIVGVFDDFLQNILGVFLLLRFALRMGRPPTTIQTSCSHLLTLVTPAVFFIRGCRLVKSFDPPFFYVGSHDCQTARVP